MNEDEPLDRVSEISEMPVTFAIGHFLASLCWGTLAGSGALLGTLIIASGFDFDMDNISNSLGILWVVGVIVGIFTLAGLVIIGLPLTLGLRQLKKESAMLYTGIGATAGFLIIAVMFEANTKPEALAFALIGAVAGGACAYRWGRWREELAAQQISAPIEELCDRRTNPIHELTH